MPGPEDRFHDTQKKKGETSIREGAELDWEATERDVEAPKPEQRSEPEDRQGG